VYILHAVVAGANRGERRIDNSPTRSVRCRKRFGIFDVGRRASQAVSVQDGTQTEYPEDFTVYCNEHERPKDGKEMNNVTINGCYDALHPGHMFFLGYAAGQLLAGESLVVFLNSDEYLRKNKREPYFNESQRTSMLLQTGIVNKVIVFDEEDASRMILEYQPRVHCVFEPYAGGCPEIDACEEIGADVVIIPKVGDWSSSKLNGRTVYDLLEETQCQ